MKSKFVNYEAKILSF